MKKYFLPILLIFLGIYNLIFTIYLFPTEGYQETMKYLKWGILLFSVLVSCYGFYMLFKKK